MADLLKDIKEFEEAMPVSSNMVYRIDVKFKDESVPDWSFWLVANSIPAGLKDERTVKILETREHEIASLSIEADDPR